MTGRGGSTGVDQARAVADAVLYEGYLLYPYRRSSGKNRIRWQFGVLVPPAWAQAHGLVDRGVAGSAESWWQQTDCLVQPTGPVDVSLRLRFLQVQHRTVEDLPGGGQAHGDAGFDEAVPREFDLRVRVDELIGDQRRFDVAAPGAREHTPSSAAPGGPRGRIVRRRWPVRASVTVTAAWCHTPAPLLRLRIRVTNEDQLTPPDVPRAHALRHSLLATHSLLTVEGGRFVSLLDPPPWATTAVRRCRNVHTFPVLAGVPGSSDTVLSAPIILYDHPRVAPESPGDLHDATEIDEILALRTLTLTDAEKQEARATDGRAADIIDRVEALPPEALRRLHGAIRSLRPGGPPEAESAPPPAATAAPGPGAAPASVLVAGTRLGPGSRVCLWPRPSGTDAHDMFLRGRTGRVEQILTDVDGSTFLGITVDDDPGADLHHWYGRLRHFRPDEVEPLRAEQVPVQ